MKILATSREAIGIIGETTWQTPPLSLPSRTALFELSSDRGEPFDDLTNSEAVQLLVERARAVQPDFELRSQNSRAVAQICQGLNGIRPVRRQIIHTPIILCVPTSWMAHLTAALAVGKEKTFPTHQGRI